jgi:hypothetical protein
MLHLIQHYPSARSSTKFKMTKSRGKICFIFFASLLKQEVRQQMLGIEKKQGQNLFFILQAL